MTRITNATTEDAQLLSGIGKIAWVDAHGESATKEDIDSYIAAKYTEKAILEELRKPTNLYHIIYVDNQPAGFSNIIFDALDANIPAPNFSELDRLYLLREFYNRKLGFDLLQFNIQLAKQRAQAGIWLYVWKGNNRAIAFYSKAGFRIVGSHDFKISDTHSNPNHQMLLTF